MSFSLSSWENPEESDDTSPYQRVENNHRVNGRRRRKQERDELDERQPLKADYQGKITLILYNCRRK